MTINITLGECLDSPAMNGWDYICDKYGINPYCINEELADDTDIIQITIEDAYKIGVLKREDNW